MVHIRLPPPTNPPVPLFHSLPVETWLVRLFDPTRFQTKALTFRTFGPLLRFDHQRLQDGAPGVDAERGIYYAAFSLSSCVVEVFGDAGAIRCGEWHLAMPRLTRPVRLLDLRESGAMRAGSVAALGKAPDHALSQVWSRYFYEMPVYEEPEGLLWYNAHNEEESIALYERAMDALVCPDSRILRLDAPALEDTLLKVTEVNNLLLIP